MNQDNPFFQPLPDPQFNRNAIKAQNEKDAVEFQRLCFEIFLMSDTGKKLADILMKKFIIPSHYDPMQNNASALSLWWDGYKSAMRKLLEEGLIHKFRVDQGGQR